MEYFGYILLSIVILLVMVLIHELGHYTVAKILGFTVDEFAVGFGPRLLSKRRKNGELWSLRAFPLGGFCAFAGETEDEETPPAPTPADADISGAAEEDNADPLSKIMKSAPPAEMAEEKPIRLDKTGKPALTFYEQKPWKRILVLLGGVTFNFLSAIIFSLIYIWAVGFPAPTVTGVYSDPQTGIVYNAFEKGDVILGINGHNITVLDNYQSLMSEYGKGDTVTFRVDRKGKIVEFKAERKTITIDVSVDKNKNGTIDEDEYREEQYTGFGFSSVTDFTGNTAGNAFKYCVPYTFKLSWAILGSFGDLITGKMPITSLTGPVGSVKLMADVSSASGLNILILLPLLASNLAIFNLLPFPALDGANVIFTAVEWIRKKPINKKVQSIINLAGLGILLLFVFIVDILAFAL